MQYDLFFCASHVLSNLKEMAGGPLLLSVSILRVRFRLRPNGLLTPYHPIRFLLASAPLPSFPWPRPRGAEVGTRKGGSARRAPVLSCSPPLPYRCSPTSQAQTGNEVREGNPGWELLPRRRRRVRAAAAAGEGKGGCEAGPAGWAGGSGLRRGGRGPRGTAARARERRGLTALGASSQLGR